MILYSNVEIRANNSKRVYINSVHILYVIANVYTVYDCIRMYIYILYMYCKNHKMRIEFVYESKKKQ